MSLSSRILILAVGVAAPCLGASAQSASQSDFDFFEKKVRPVLVQHCYKCHSAEAKPLQAGLRLDTREGLRTGGDTGPAIVPGQPGASLLVQALRHESFEMPPDGRLPEGVITDFERWIQNGAADPRAAATSAAAPGPLDIEAGRSFWSFQPVRFHELPPVGAAGWPQRRLDHFVLAGLEPHGLAPAPPTGRGVLLRRLSFDLIGLPPTPKEIEEFSADRDEAACVKVVDRLLASPHYGERWGRYWLDLARYSDQTASWLSPIAQAWLYRDWVVRALNEDLPYDEFVRRQLAADLLAETAPGDTSALGFLGLSPVYWKELKLDYRVIEGTVAEEWEERIDAVGRTFLGLTLACARCHDHKFDPVSTEDYYALAGVMAGTRLIDRPIIPEPEAAIVRQARERVTALQERLKPLAAAKTPEAAQQTEDLQRQIAEIESGTPHYHTPLAHAVDDAALHVLPDGPDATKLEYKPGESHDLHVHIRGNPANPGPLVPRRFLTVLSDGPPQPFASGSGRRELAEAIVTDAAPLAARVIVNRVWVQHFGRGLVETPSDFGAQGARPTHPALLDDLAARFIEHGWSLKWLHREIALSAAYRQSSRHDAAHVAADPENRWLWRASRRRLEIEAWRDAMLAVSGALDRRVGGPALELDDPHNARRTLYGRVDRYDLDEMLRIHDFPDPLAHSPARPPTVTALQQLFVLNGPLIERQAALLAERLLREHPGDVRPQIQFAYRLLYGREAAPDEVQLGLEFLASSSGDPALLQDAWRQYAQALLASNEFLFVE